MFQSLCIHHRLIHVLCPYTLDTMNSYIIIFNVIAIGLQKCGMPQLCCIFLLLMGELKKGVVFFKPPYIYLSLTFHSVYIIIYQSVKYLPYIIVNQRILTLSLDTLKVSIPCPLLVSEGVNQCRNYTQKMYNRDVKYENFQSNVLFKVFR